MGSVLEEKKELSKVKHGKQYINGTDVPEILNILASTSTFFALLHIWMYASDESMVPFRLFIHRPFVPYHRTDPK